MIVYRAVRKPKCFWTIECFDREFQISYTYDKFDDEPHEFVSRQGCERWILRNIIKTKLELPEEGEAGPWLTPEYFTDGTF